MVVNLFESFEGFGGMLDKMIVIVEVIDLF